MDPRQHDRGGHGADDVGLVVFDRGIGISGPALAVLAAAMFLAIKPFRLSAL